MSAHGSAHRSHCQDCGTPLTGPYCFVCGQHDVDYHRSLGHVVEDGLESFLHVDGKFFQSMRYLFTRPGFLTKEFVDGRRTRYSNPIRFYIFASFLYFAVGALVSPPAAVHQTVSFNDGVPAAPAGATPRSGAGPKAPSVVRGPAVGEWLNRRIKGAKAAYGDEYPTVLEREITHLLPTMLFLCMPLLAVLLKAAYPGSGRFYIEHLIFSLHTLTLVFLASVGTYLLRAALKWTGPGAPDLVGLASFGLVTWLIYRSFRTVYGQGVGRTLFKLAFVGAAFGIILIVGITTVSVASFYIVSDGA
jgi:hypothetical protein